jgi:hypothetical protein
LCRQVSRDTFVSLSLPRLPMGRSYWGASGAGAGQGYGWVRGQAQGQGAKARFWVCGGKGGYGCGYHNVDAHRDHCFHCKLCYDFSKRSADTFSPPKGGGKGGGWQQPKKGASGGGKPAATGAAPKDGAPAGKGNLVSGAKWFSQANGDPDGLSDDEMGEPAGDSGAAKAAATVEEQRVKDDIASSRAMAKHCRQAAKALKELAVSSSLGEALAEEIGRQVALAEQHERATGQQLEQQRAELPHEVQLEKKRGLLKSLKASADKQNEEHRALLAKAEVLQAEILAKAEQAARSEEKATAVDKEIQEVFRKMGEAGTTVPPPVQEARPPVTAVDDFTEAEKIEMYAARAARAEAAQWNERQQRAAAAQEAAVQEQNRAALARAAEEAAKVERERLLAQGQQPPVGPPAKDGEHQGEGSGQGAEARGRSRSANRSPSSASGSAATLEAKMAANAAARRKAEGK